jgi:hypothetical protein
MSRPLQPAEIVRDNLDKLAADLWKKTRGRPASDPETKIALFINTCLFKTYESGSFK